MRLSVPLFCVLLLFATNSSAGEVTNSSAGEVTNSSAGEVTTPPDHSIVNIVFVTPISRTSMTHQMGGEGDRVLVGNTAVPIGEFSPISISIDNEFVGHAMVGFTNITPTFVLQSGTHEFSFSCDGYKPVTQKLKVIGTGSNQYLLIKMQKNSSPDQKSDATGHSSEPSSAEVGVTTR